MKPSQRGRRPAEAGCRFARLLPVFNRKALSGVTKVTAVKRDPGSEAPRDGIRHPSDLACRAFAQVSDRDGGGFPCIELHSGDFCESVSDSAAETTLGSLGGARSGGLRRRLPRRLPGEGGLWARFRSGTLRTLVRRFLVSTVRSLPNAARERPLFRNCYPWCTNRGNSTVRVNSWQRGRRFDAQGCIFMATALGAAQRACDASPAAGCALGDGAKAGAGSGMQHSCERKYP